MQRAEHQVAGFRRAHRQAYGLQIAQLADENNVRVFTQRRTQRIVKRQRMRADFTLIDQAFLGLMHELNRVFHREDVAVFVFVDVIDHRRQRRRFTRAGGAGDQHHAARLVGDID